MRALFEGRKDILGFLRHASPFFSYSDQSPLGKQGAVQLCESFITLRGVIDMEPFVSPCVGSRLVLPEEKLKKLGRPIFNPDPFPMPAGIRDICLGRVVDILEASGAFDPGSNPGRGVLFHKLLNMVVLW